ncbi:MAG: Hsp20/alpha crystallin family protein [Chloroflexaceae bacterium]|nr:Hsp20/alpha crystallin family protein [Chloroflexaceae bacterium]
MSTMIVRRPFRNAWNLGPLMNELAWEVVAPRRGMLNVAMDVSETADGYMVEVSLPGVNPADVAINLENRTLTITGERKQAESAEGVQFHLRERASGSFERTLTFPAPINAEAVQATYEHGVLKLSLPKAEAAKPRKIEIQTAPSLIENGQN